MPNLNPLVPGDVPYPQYSVTTTKPISAALQILKGRLYHPDASGDLVAPVGSLNAGIFQARETPDAQSGAAGEDSVQVLSPRSRMIFTTQTVGLLVGQDVIYVVASTDVTNGSKSSDLHVGRIFEIYTKDADGNDKKITEMGDSVVVETVGP